MSTASLNGFDSLNHGWPNLFEDAETTDRAFHSAASVFEFFGEYLGAASHAFINELNVFFLCHTVPLILLTRLIGNLKVSKIIVLLKNLNVHLLQS